MTILISIQSPFEIWTIPPSYVDRLRTRFPSHTFLHARTDDEALADVPGGGRRLRGADYAGATGCGAPAAVAAQPGRGRRRHAVSRDGRQSGRHHELAGDVGRHHRGARARRHARALPSAAARVSESGRARVGAGRDWRRRQPPDRGRPGARRGPWSDRRRGGPPHDAPRRARHRPAPAREWCGARRVDGCARRSPARPPAGGGRRRHCRAAHARHARPHRPPRTIADVARRDPRST